MNKKVLLILAILMSGVFSTFAQVKYGETAEQQQACKEALTIYRTQRDQKDPAVYLAWQKAIEICPCKVSHRMYTDGIKFIKAEIKADPTRKEVLVDSLYLIYDQRIEHFPATKSNPNNGCYASGRKAFEIKKYNKERSDEVIDMLENTIDCMKESSSAAFMSTWYLMTFDKRTAYKEAGDVENQKILEEKLLLKYLSLQEYCDYNITNAKKEKTKEGYVKSKNNIDEIFVIIAECDVMVPLLQEKVKADPENFDLKKKALRLMNKKDCTETEFYLLMAEAVCDKEPSAPCMYSLGMGHLKKGDKTKALENFENAAKIGQDDPDYEKYLLRAAQLAAVKGQSGKAKKYANQVLQINPNNGKAILVKGDAVRGTGGCDDGKLGRYCPYWISVDIYRSAKAKDPSVASEANKRIAAAKAGFPSVEEVFQYGKKAGDTISCPCTGGSTTIRTR